MGNTDACDRDEVGDDARLALGLAGDADNVHDVRDCPGVIALVDGAVRIEREDLDGVSDIAQRHDEHQHERFLLCGVRAWRKKVGG